MSYVYMREFGNHLSTFLCKSHVLLLFLAIQVKTYKI